MTRKKEEGPEDLARKIVSEIEDDLRSRAGIGNVWNSIDPATQEGIRKRWAELAAGVLSGGGAGEP